MSEGRPGGGQVRAANEGETHSILGGFAASRDQHMVQAFDVSRIHWIPAPLWPPRRWCRQSGQVLAAAVVIDCQDAELPAGPECVRQEVQGSPLVRAQWHRHRGSAAPRALAATASAHRQALFPIDAVELLLVHDHALALQHDAHAPVAEATVLLGDLVHLLTDFRPRHWARTNGAAMARSGGRSRRTLFGSAPIRTQARR